MVRVDGRAQGGSEKFPSQPWPVLPIRLQFHFFRQAFFTPPRAESFWRSARLAADTYALRMESTSENALADLVRRAQKGDEGAQRELIVSYQHRVAGFVYAMTGRSDYVEDLAQPVFIKMIRALDRLQAPAQFESWLFRLARNTCIDQLRRQKLRRIFLPFGVEHENLPEPA